MRLTWLDFALTPLVRFGPQRSVDLALVAHLMDIAEDIDPSTIAEGIDPSTTTLMAQMSADTVPKADHQ